MNRYRHETDLAPVGPQDVLVPHTRLFTGSCLSRAYVLNRTTGKIVEACGHRHYQNSSAQCCAEKMIRKRKATELVD